MENKLAAIRKNKCWVKRKPYQKSELQKEIDTFYKRQTVDK